MTHDEMIAVIQAAKDGRQIQLRRNSQESWRNVVSPRFDFDSFNYRVKPEPREWLVNVNNLVPITSKQMTMGSGFIWVREVIE